MLEQLIKALRAHVMFFFPEAESRLLEQQARAHLQNVFQVGKLVQSTQTGELFKVLEVDCAGAIVENSRLRARVDWVQSCGKLRVKLMHRWRTAPLGLA